VLRAEKVYLRAREESDVAVLHRELHDDVAGHARADGKAWRPQPLVTGSPYDPKPPSDEVARFTVVAVADDEVAGSTLLWGIDLHNRSAHIGLTLVPSARGRGFGSETLDLLAGYAFDQLGLHRLQLETLGDNEAMLGSARKAGYRLEGTLRDSGWVMGEFVDEVILGLLADEWRAER
jgi:RimJ/RimL family protein N-acetyltransferase